MIGGPHSEHNILTPIPVKIANYGNATATGVEIVVESESGIVVNHSNFFMSPVITDSSEAVEGNVVYLGQGRFRRVFKIGELHPGNSVQLNNAGLPRNLLGKEKSITNSTLSITTYEQGRSVRQLMFGIWLLDTSQINFRSALAEMAEKFKAEYHAMPILRRFGKRVRHRQYENRLALLEITKTRSVTIPGESETFLTVDAIQSSFGSRYVTGSMFIGGYGLF